MGNTIMPSPKLYDVLIVGGGPAGLSMAGGLARQTHTALILDSGTYRNAVATHMHNVPGWDHVHPADFRAKARDDLQKRYASIEFQTAKITQVKKLEEEGGLFEAVDEQGEKYRGRKLGLGTGVRDRLEGEPEGYAECWGRGVFHCLFCHGFEERGCASSGVLVGGFVSKPEMATHVARMAKRLSGHTNIYTNASPEMAEPIKALIKGSKITVDTRPIKSLSLVDDGPNVKITFTDGTTKTEGFIASHPAVEQQGGHLAEQLGLEMTDGGDITTNPPFNETSVKGCFAAGDAATPMKSVVSAIYQGSFAGAGFVTQLQAEMEAKDEL